MTDANWLYRKFRREIVALSDWNKTRVTVCDVSLPPHSGTAVITAFHKRQDGAWFVGVKYPCGHSGEVSIPQGSTTFDDFFALLNTYMEVTECKSCEKKVVYRETEHSGYAGLWATRKQAAWADDVRKKKIDEIEIYVLKRIVDEVISRVPDVILIEDDLRAVFLLRSISDASWWIGTKDMETEALFLAAAQYLCRHDGQGQLLNAQGASPIRYEKLNAKALPEPIWIQIDLVEFAFVGGLQEEELEE